VSKKSKAVDTSSKPPSTPGSKQVWKAMDRGSAVAAGVIGSRASELTWKLATGKTPPKDKKNPDADLREVAAWAFLGAGLTELIRVLIRRATASYWVKSTGHLPPGMKPAKRESRA
jgi:hypothetical protein